MKTVFALIAALLPAGGGVALAAEPPAPASPEAIVQYRESGAWAADLRQAVRRARRDLRRELAKGTRRTKPAMVLDIDDTSLSNYECLKAVDFDRAASECGRQLLPAVPQTLRLYRWAKRRGVAVWFVTGRREVLRETTEGALRHAGYTGRWKLRMRPDEQPRRWRDGWKARVRRGITRRHRQRILANLGDQRSDLDGGWARRRYKLPNPMYVIRRA